MTVEFNHDAVMSHFKKKRQKTLVQTAHMGVNIAALNVGKDGKEHVDIGTSRNTKQFSPKNIGLDDDIIRIEVGQDYDVYLERKFGIMAIAYDKIKPWFNKFLEMNFG